MKTSPNHALQRTATSRRRLQSAGLMAAVAELGPLGGTYMKSAQTILLLLLSMACLYGEEKFPTIVLTSEDVHTNSVRVTTPPDYPYQNVVFRYRGKTPEEIEKIVLSIPRCAQIMKNGIAITQTDGGACSPIRDGKTKNMWDWFCCFAVMTRQNWPRRHCVVIKNLTLGLARSNSSRRNQIKAASIPDGFCR